MALVSTLVQSAIDSREAKILGDTLADSLTATGDDSQANGLPLTATINNITTADERNNTVVLPKIVSFASTFCVVKNNTGETLNIYPASGESINALAANTGVTLTSGSILVFYKATSTKWVK